MSVKIKKISSEVFSAGTAFFACELLEVFVWKKKNPNLSFKRKGFRCIIKFPHSELKKKLIRCAERSLEEESPRSFSTFGNDYEKPALSEMSSSSWWGQCCHTTRTAAYAPVQVSVFRIRPPLAMSWRGHSIPSVNAVTWYMVFFELQLSSMPASRLHLTKETSVHGLIHETSGCAFYSILVLIACLLAYLGFARSKRFDDASVELGDRQCSPNPTPRRLLWGLP